MLMPLPAGGSKDEYVTKSQLEELKAASELERELLEIPVEQEEASVTLKIPAMGMALLTVYLT